MTARTEMRALGTDQRRSLPAQIWQRVRSRWYATSPLTIAAAALAIAAIAGITHGAMRVIASAAAILGGTP